MIKIICKNEEWDKKSKKGSCDIELVMKGDPHVTSSQLGIILKEIYDTNPVVLYGAFRVLDHLIDEDGDDYE